jgi:iron(III) transport system permease protein
MNAGLIEKTSHWRSLAAVGFLVPVVWPTLTMLTNSLGVDAQAALRPSFETALASGLRVAFLVTVLSFLAGLPFGILMSRFRFPFRNTVLALAALPLLVPTFLWAIGWSALIAWRGAAGVILSFAIPSVSLVMFTSLISARSLSASQIEAAFLAGGEAAVLRHMAGYVVVPAAGAALLAGMLSLSDPGPGQIFGLATAAGELLTSFSAFYDFNLAARQCLLLAAIVLVVAIPSSFLVAPQIASEILVRQTRPGRLSEDTVGSRSALVAVFVFCTALVFPLFGLIRPVLSDASSLGRASAELTRTAAATATYMVGSGVVATVLGVLFAAAIGRNARLRSVAVAFCFVLMAVPAAVTALAFVEAGTQAPQWTEVLFRSRLAVALAAGGRVFPVAALIAMRTWNAMPRTWALAGAVHGVPLFRYVGSVVFPFLAPGLGMSVAICGLLATADVVTVLLVHPPGQSSLPLAIFTIMANAPESLVSALCLVYVTSAVLLLWIFFSWDRSHSK